MLARLVLTCGLDISRSYRGKDLRWDLREQRHQDQKTKFVFESVCYLSLVLNRHFMARKHQGLKTIVMLVHFSGDFSLVRRLNFDIGRDLNYLAQHLDYL